MQDVAKPKENDMNIHTQIDVLSGVVDRIETKYFIAVDVCAEWSRELAWGVDTDHIGYDEAEAELNVWQRLLRLYDARLARLVELEDALGRARDLVESAHVGDAADRWAAAYEDHIDQMFDDQCGSMPFGPVDPPETTGYTTGRVVR